MTDPIYGPWIAHNATPDITCPPDAVGKAGRYSWITPNGTLADFEVTNLKWVSWHDSRLVRYAFLQEPVRGERVHYLSLHGNEPATHTLTIPTIDGALIPGEYIGPGGVITVTEVR